MPTALVGGAAEAVEVNQDRKQNRLLHCDLALAEGSLAPLPFRQPLVPPSRSKGFFKGRRQTSLQVPNLLPASQRFRWSSNLPRPLPPPSPRLRSPAVALNPAPLPTAVSPPFAPRSVASPSADRSRSRAYLRGGRAAAPEAAPSPRVKGENSDD